MFNNKEVNMAKKMNLMDSIAALKRLSEEEAEKLAIDSDVPGEPEANIANDEAIEEGEDIVPSNDEILKKIETATEELEDELTAQELSDELKESVRKLLKLKEEEIRSDLEKEYAEKQAAFEDELVDQTDEYMTKVAEEWLAQNKVALKESIQAKRVQAFVKGFKKLLEENNIELPADAEAEIEKYQEENEELKDELNKEISESFKLRRALKEAKKELLVEKKISSLGLAMSKADRFRAIMEDVEYNDDEEKFEKELDREVKELDEEETGTTMDSQETVDDKSDLENGGLKLEEAIAKIRSSKK